ncbi:MULTISPECIES: hypothetical protein [Shinella]|jgi:hypothetical protein|uniref:Beta-barrel assembly complex subunit BamF n=1 Tax=Shinella granuli TaxID=323621 RepID=A0A4R2CWX7_SHIGR|nr:MULTISPECIES: hypothetical protein [Shinella]ANH03223.1 hypothetical protein shn_03650 [Shinella sp. HZN7]TCN45651.1 hypothetical protein EV665_106128 [Shinella granuli]
MGMTRKIRVRTGLLGLLGASFVLTGCMGPTYGTGKTAGEQLVEDVGNAVMIRPDNKEAKNIRYQPRGSLVVPKDQLALTTPQQSVASKDNPEWLESPEDMRERLRAEADENSNSTTFRSPLASQGTTNRKLSAAEQTAAYRDARRLQMGAYADKRRYLSDPPLDYRRLPEEAQADLGEPEKVKERRRKKEAKAAKQSGSSWWPF